MQLLAEGLARSGRLNAAGVQVVADVCGPNVTAGVLAHPLLVPTAAMLDGVEWFVLRELLALHPPAEVLERVFAGVRPEALVDIAWKHPLPAVEGTLARAALAGDWLARWEALRAGPVHLRAQLLHRCAADVAEGRRWFTWAWLGAAVQCPDQLTTLLPTVPAVLRPTLERYAAHADSGGDLVQLFAAEMTELATEGAVPDWNFPVTRRGLVSLSDAVLFTGLPEVASRALTTAPAVQRPAVWAQILTHPHLAGSDVAATAQAAQDAWVADQVGAQWVEVPGAAEAIRSDESDLATWVGAGHDSPRQLALAWQLLQSLTPAACDLTVAGRLAAAVLMCADRPGGTVAGRVREWLTVHAGDRSDGGAGPVASALTGQMPGQDWVAPALLDLAAVVHDRPGLGVVNVQDVAQLWVELDRPAWLGRLVGEFFAGVPEVSRPQFVDAITAVGGQFTGTFADLVATATAIVA